MSANGSIKCRSVTRTDWDALTALFGSNGACGGCWCMHWCVPRGGKLWEANKGEPNRRALREQLDAGAVHASIALRDGAPVGWCRHGPFESFPRLVNSRTLNRDPGPGTWSVVCFFIHRRDRGSGVASALLDHAVAEARSHHATRCEGYPVAVDGYQRGRAPAAFAWTGVPRLFEAAGFSSFLREDDTRPIYRLALTP